MPYLCGLIEAAYEISMIGIEFVFKNLKSLHVLSVTSNILDDLNLEFAITFSGQVKTICGIYFC